VLLLLFFEAYNKTRAYKPPHEANPLPDIYIFFFKKRGNSSLNSPLSSQDYPYIHIYIHRKNRFALEKTEITVRSARRATVD